MCKLPDGRDLWWEKLGLALVGRALLSKYSLKYGVPDELWKEVHDIVQETGIKTVPMEKKCKKGKWLSEILQDGYYCPHFTDKEIEFKQVNLLGSQREKKSDKTKI